MHRFLQGLAFAGLAILTVACSSGGGAPAPARSRPRAPASAPAGGEIVVVAKDLAFQPTSLTIKADTPTEIVLDNQEAFRTTSPSRTPRARRSSRARSCHPRR